MKMAAKSRVAEQLLRTTLFRDLLTTTETAVELQTSPALVSYYLKIGKLRPAVVLRSGKRLFSLRDVLELKRDRERRRSKQGGVQSAPSP